MRVYKFHLLESVARNHLKSLMLILQILDKTRECNRQGVSIVLVCKDLGQIVKNVSIAWLVYLIQVNQSVVVDVTEHFASGGV